MAKDRKPDDGRARTGATRAGAGGNPNRAKGGRTRPPTTVVANAQKRPWGLIAGAIAVVVFAAAVIGYAVTQVNEANAGKVEAVDEIDGVQSYEYDGGNHVSTPVDYEQSPPVGGEHAPVWLDCGVYDEPVREENAVHDLEHGTVWFAYDPDLDEDEVDDLAEVLPQNGIMAPYPGLDAPVVVTVWGRQLELVGADDPRLPLFLHRYGGGETAPEPFASCAGGVPDPQGGGEPAGPSTET